MRQRPRLVHLGLALALAGCGGAAPPTAVTATARDLGPLPYPDPIRGRDGGFSARFGGHSVWVFGDTILGRAGSDGSSWRTSSWSWTDDTDASDGIAPLQQQTDKAGVTVEFLPFTVDEAAFNDAHQGDHCAAGTDCGARWALWPGPVVVDEANARALVFYSKVSARPGAWNFHGVGESLAVWRDSTLPPERPALATASADSTILWPAGEPELGAGAVVDGDMLYAYACPLDGFAHPCSIARAHLAAAMQHDAWAFFDGAQWVADGHAARPVFVGAPMLTVHRSEYLGSFVAFYVSGLGPHIAMRTAPHPEGPWSNEVTVADALPPEDPQSFDYGALAHHELARDNGRIEYLSYCRPGLNFTSKMPLVEITLAR